jgi:serine/threonine protein kinase
MQRGRLLGFGKFGRVFELLHGNDIVMVGKYSERNKYMDAEIEMHSKLQHPNIVAFIKSYHYGSTSLMCLEYCPNGTLMTIAQREPKVKEVMFYLRQLRDALAYVHSMNIIHRDVKLSNLLLKGTVVKLADFGLSAYGPTAEGYIGTEVYMAPEIIQRQSYNFLIDVWALGVCGYALLHDGKSPFEVPDDDELQVGRYYIQNIMLPDDVLPALKPCFLRVDSRPNINELQL